MQIVVTIFIFDLSRCHEDPVLHLHSSCGSVVRSIQFTLLAQLGKDLRRFHRVSPHVVAVTEDNEQKRSLQEAINDLLEHLAEQAAVPTWHS